MTHRARRGGAAITAVLFAVVALMFVPVYSMVVIASQPDDSDLRGVWFHGFHLLGNVGTMFGDGRFPRYFLNSLILAGGVGVLDVVFSAAAGYALARLRFPGRRLLFGAVVATLGLAPPMIIVPLYVIVRTLGWVDSYQGMIVPMMISAFGVFLVRQFALGIPGELLDSARVDGAGEFRTFARIAVPLLRPALLTLFLVQFLAQWDNLLWPLLVANRPSLWTLPVGLAGFQTEHGVNVHLMTTAALVIAIPPLLLLMLLQKYYVSGLTLGGVKQ
jgi:multiple sugar transport system permease protein